MRYLVILLLIIAVHIEAKSQVKGLSASKLVALSTSTVPRHQIEFEPSFSFFSAKQRWTHMRNREDLFNTTDSMSLAKELGFRFSYGAGEKTEVGSYITANTSVIALSVKHRFFDNSRISFAGLGGASIFSGDGVYSRQVCNAENGTAVVAGLIGNAILSEKWSVDMDVQSQAFIKKGFDINCRSDFANIDFSYRPIPTVQLINSFSYYKGIEPTENISSERLTITPGAALESSDKFIVVVGLPFDVWGKNTEIFKGVSFALTILFD